MASLFNGALRVSRNHRVARAGALPSPNSPLRVSVSSRWCASLSKLSTESAGELALAALQPYVNDEGKPTLAALQASWHREQESWRREQESWRREQASWAVVKSMLEKVNSMLEKDLVRAEVDLLKARGLGNTRGLFEHLQEKLHISSRLKGASFVGGLKGAPLWEVFLRAEPQLASCIERSTGVSASNVEKQAMLCYNVYSSLSEHIQEGKTLAELQAARQGAIIEFEKGPLSSVQVKILLCIGQAAGVHIGEGNSLVS